MKIVQWLQDAFMGQIGERPGIIVESAERTSSKKRTSSKSRIIVESAERTSSKRIIDFLDTISPTGCPTASVVNYVMQEPNKS